MNLNWEIDKTLKEVPSQFRYHPELLNQRETPRLGDYSDYELEYRLNKLEKDIAAIQIKIEYLIGLVRELRNP